MRFNRRSKFGSVKKTVDGITFHSKKEADRYSELRLLERAGMIHGLTLQPRFVLQPSFKYKGKTERAIEYVADFQYVSGIPGNTKFEVVEDSKGFRTDVYAMKRKMFLHKYGDRYVFIES